MSTYFIFITPLTSVLLKSLRVLGLFAFVLLSSFSISSFADQAKREKVYIFTIDFCPICISAKDYFETHQIPYTEFNIDQNPRAKEVFEENDGKGIPLIIVKGKRLYGFDVGQFEELYQ